MAMDRPQWADIQDSDSQVDSQPALPRASPDIPLTPDAFEDSQTGLTQTFSTVCHTVIQEEAAQTPEEMDFGCTPDGFEVEPSQALVPALSPEVVVLSQRKASSLGAAQLVAESLAPPPAPTQSAAAPCVAGDITSTPEEVGVAPGHFAAAAMAGRASAMPTGAVAACQAVAVAGPSSSTSWTPHVLTQPARESARVQATPKRKTKGRQINPQPSAPTPQSRKRRRPPTNTTLAPPPPLPHAPAAAAEVPEEDRQRRKRHREDGVAFIKGTPEYAQAQQALERGKTSEEDFPATPDPHDETITKRSWEKGVQQWRGKLKNIAGKLKNIAAGCGEQA